MASVIVRRQSGQIPPLPVSPLLARIYAHRSIRSARELVTDLKALPLPELLTDIDRAAALLSEGLKQQLRIVIIADFDADGATSCALAIRCLRAFGAKNIGFVVPDRFKYGYGLTPEIVQVAAEQKPDLLITVDNGIASIDGVAMAKSMGIKVLITDHHLPGESLPPADAIVNPNQAEDCFPSKNLAGVGVIFYVMLALRSQLRATGWFAANNIPEPNMARFLDLVAFGTVADVVPLDHTNRILIEQGLRRIRSGHCSPGISALIDVAQKQQHQLSSSDIGFALGPRLNAAGRLEDMSRGIQCLLCDDAIEARKLAWELDRLNKERRVIETNMRTQAESAVARLSLNNLPFGLCLFDTSWHQGVIGILAARIREKTHRPVIVFAPEDESQIKGSARSIPGLHIRDLLAAIATQYPDLLSKFGGHAMAAGLSLPLSSFQTFSTAFDREVRRHLNSHDLRGVVLSDGELAPQEMTLSVAEELRTASPWGQGFPEPLFDGIFDIISHRIVGKQHLKMLVRPSGHEPCRASAPIDAIAFNKAAQSPCPQQLRLAYRLDVNEWRGQRSAQLIIEHFEELS